MKKIVIARTAGFCMGVRRAVEMALDAANQQKDDICTFGPLIHNPQVLSLLEEKGISVIEEVPETASGTVLIRAHGIPPGTREDLARAGFRVIDATCPRVIKVQTIIHKQAGQGYASIIVGDRNHPEVVGLLGYTMGKGYVVDSLADLEALPEFDKAIIVAQTTQDTGFYEQVRQWAADRHPHYRIFDTICDSTERRQEEVRRLSRQVDTVVVVGGRDSGNTRRLFQIAGQSGTPSFHIEDETEIDAERLASARSIGITAGASTPNWVIRKVCRSLENSPARIASGWRNRIHTFQRLMLLTNAYVALGSGCLCLASTKLLRMDAAFSHLFIAVVYVLSMHILNNLTGKTSDRFNDPDRAFFYDRHRNSLAVMAAAAGSAGLLSAFSMGVFPFLILLAMTVLGLLYNVRLAPRGWMGGKYGRLRDIPGSKTVLIAVAWGIVTSVFPPLSTPGALSWRMFPVFLWATGMVLARTVFFDILDMQGDRIVGKATIPILLGETRSIRLLKAVLAGAILLLVLSGALGIVSGLGFALVMSPLFLAGILLSYEHRVILPGIRLEFLIETHLVLAGAIAALWTATTP